VTYTGRCACGAVSATITGEPVRVGQCWCRQCQQAAGGGPTNNAIFADTDVTLSGEVTRHSYTAESGNTVYHDYCARCGTPVLGCNKARPHFLGFRLGFLDEGHGLRPQIALWTDEAPDWAVIDPALQNYPRQPPPPTAKD